MCTSHLYDVFVLPKEHRPGMCTTYWKCTAYQWLFK